jgi:putative transposase
VNLIGSVNFQVHRPLDHFVRYINATCRRTGTLWEGRYKSAIIDSERYLMTCARYIELNPVRAGMVGHPAEYRWSSYRHNALQGGDALIQAHGLYLGLGDDDLERRRNYAALFAGQIDDTEIAAKRAMTQKDSVLGNDRFREQIAQVLQRRVAKRAHGGDRKSERFRESGGSSTLTRMALT